MLSVKSNGIEKQMPTRDDVEFTKPTLNLIGTKINVNTYDRWFEETGKVKATVTVPTPTFAIGGAVGVDIYVTSFLNLDLGYRILYGLDNVLSHEFAIAARFPIPDLRK